MKIYTYHGKVMGLKDDLKRFESALREYLRQIKNAQYGQRKTFNFSISDNQQKIKDIPYDPTAGVVYTPAGPGRYVEFNGSGTVTVEMDYMYMVEFPAEKCYIEPDCKEQRKGGRGK